MTISASKELQDKFCRTYLLTEPQLRCKKPFAHQLEALERLHKWSKTKHPEAGGIVVLPTGGGKTFTAWRFLCTGPLSEGYKVLWLAHTHHLLEQAFFSLETEVEQIAKTRKQLKVRVVSGTPGHFRPAHIETSDDVVIGTLQTITTAYRDDNKQFKAFLESAGDKLVVVFDEAHHSPAPSYCRLITTLREHFAEMRLLGLTATPTHMNKEKVGWLKKLFPQGILYQVDAGKLIADNILAKPVFEQAPTSIEPDFDEQKYRDWVKDYRDLPEELITQLAANKRRNEVIASTYVQHREKYGKTIIFADRWFQCDYLREALKKRGVEADVVYSRIDAEPGSAEERNRRTEDDNKQAIKKFRRNEIDVLINVRMLTEGTDIPDVETVFLTRQTTSKILLTQMVGRALRGTSAGGTEKAYIVSFVDDWQHAIDWAEYDLEDGGIVDDPPKPSGKPPLHLISIDLVRQLCQQMDSGVNINVEPFLNLIPVGWYRVEIETQAEGKDDTEVVHRLIMVFENEKAGYENFIAFLKAVEYERLEPFVEPDVCFDEVREQLQELQDGFFAASQSIGENLLTNLFYIARHVAQNDRESPDWFEFQKRDEHDLDRIAQDLINRCIGLIEQRQHLREEYEREDLYWQVIYPNFNYFWSHFNACVSYILEQAEKRNPGDGWIGTTPPAAEPSDEVKESIKQRDAHRCRCCGCTEHLQVDHINPKYHGGSHDPKNLQTLCKTCNKCKDLKEISFLSKKPRLINPPSSFPELPLPQNSEDVEQWRQFLYRSVNFFYEAAAVESITLGQYGFYAEGWSIRLRPGHNPYWLQPYLRELQQRIESCRTQSRLPGPKKLVIKTADVTLLPLRDK